VSLSLLTKGLAYMSFLAYFSWKTEIQNDLSV